VRVEANEKVSETLVTVLFPPFVMTWMAPAKSLELVHDVLMAPTSVLRLGKRRARYVCGFVILELILSSS